MAVTTGDNLKKMGATFTNELGFIKLTYDGSVDSLLNADSVRLAQVDSKIVVTKATVAVETAVTSGGAPAIDVGYETADPNAILAAEVVANLTDDDVVAASVDRIVVDAGDFVTLNVSTADLTAGKFHVLIEYTRHV